MKFLHLYPYRLGRLDGGALRLDTALEATRQLGESAVVWWDADARKWRDDEVLGSPSSPERGCDSIKRKIFPQTLYESGWRAVRSLSALARVHALPSWMETTGLSSLEAAVMGCSLVVSPNGDTRDYFGDAADYCDPASALSIRNAVLRAYERPVPTELANRIRTEYTWQKSAEATYSAYRRILA